MGKSQSQAQTLAQTIVDVLNHLSGQSAHPTNQPLPIQSHHLTHVDH